MENAKYACGAGADGNSLKITFSGRLDTDFINNEMANILYKTNRCGQDVIIDLGEVDYVSSSFLRLCISIAKAENMDNRKVSVVRLSPPIKKVFKIAGLDLMLSEGV